MSLTQPLLKQFIVTFQRAIRTEMAAMRRRPRAI